MDRDMVAVEAMKNMLAALDISRLSSQQVYTAMNTIPLMAYRVADGMVMASLKRTLSQEEFDQIKEGRGNGNL
jgi:hypothetical protein